MNQASPPRRPWVAAATAFAVAFAALALFAAGVLALALRGDATRTATDLRAQVTSVARAVDGAPLAEARAAVAGSPVAVRVIGPRGGVRAAGGPVALWARGGAPLPARAAVWGAGATVGHGFVEEAVDLGDGGRVVARAPLAMGTGGLLSGGWPLLFLIAAGALAAAIATWWARLHRDGRLRAVAARLDAASAGRPAPADPRARGAWRHLGDAVTRAGMRMGELRAATRAPMEPLGAVLAPLPLPVAARTPAGGLVRNEALERLVRRLDPADADAVEDAVRAGLAGTGASSRRLVLSDGRALEAETWAVPGGRLVALAERTEQARLEELRRNLTGSAARSLRGPIRAIRERAGDLRGRVPAGAEATVREIAGSAERLDRIVGRMLRSAEGEDRPVRTRPVSARSIAFALGQGHDARLRERGLRLEHDIADDLPALEVDPGLVHEILAELLENASAATPRGGVVTLRARNGAPGMVELAVVDTGAGIPGRERALVMEPFGRGEGAAARPGAGLGLGVARALAERMGGRIAIDPGPPGVARVELPAAVAAEPAEDAGALTPAAAAAP